MTVIEFERNQAFGLAIGDGNGEFYGRLRFDAVGDSATQVSLQVGVPGMFENADISLLRSITERWLHNTENLIYRNTALPSSISAAGHGQLSAEGLLLCVPDGQCKMQKRNVRLG